MDVLDEVRAMVNTGTVSRSRLTALIREIMPDPEKKPREKREVRPEERPSETRKYPVIERLYTCKHCKSKWSSPVELKNKNDSCPAFTVDGKVQIITVHAPAQVKCATATCNHCETFVKRMEREELEKRYLKLLKYAGIQYSYEETVPLVPHRPQPKREREEEEVVEIVTPQILRYPLMII